MLQLASGLWFTNSSHVLPTSRVVYQPITHRNLWFIAEVKHYCHTISDRKVALNRLLLWVSFPFRFDLIRIYQYIIDEVIIVFIWSHDVTLLQIILWAAFSSLLLL